MAARLGVDPGDLSFTLVNPDYVGGPNGVSDTQAPLISDFNLRLSDPSQPDSWAATFRLTDATGVGDISASGGGYGSGSFRAVGMGAAAGSAIWSSLLLMARRRSTPQLIVTIGFPGMRRAVFTAWPFLWMRRMFRVSGRSRPSVLRMPLATMLMYPAKSTPAPGMIRSPLCSGNRWRHGSALRLNPCV